jgi:N-acetylglucosamine-6-phosphate deacetylase
MPVRLGVAAAIVDGELVRGDVEVDSGLVAAVGLTGTGKGLAVPGLVDLQVNGYAGIDVLSATPRELVELGSALSRDGVLWYQPTLISAPLDAMRGALATIGRVAGPDTPARILGAHLEGPFLAPGFAGAHASADLRKPDLGVLASLLGAGCDVTMLTLAPELDGATDVIAACAERGILVSLGHSDARAGAAHAGFDRGASAVTHLFNAMRPFTHRDPCLAGTALARTDVTVMLIADGVHVAREALLVAWRAARERFVLVSDATAAATRGDGSFRLGPVEVTVTQGVARTPEGKLAGAVRPLACGLRMLIELGVPLVDAVAAVTSRPARLLGRTDAGRLTLGGPADLVVLDEDFAVVQVMRDGIPLV